MRTYSPASPQAPTRILALMVLADGHVCRSEMKALDALHATAQLQLHKIIWPGVEKGV